MKKLLAIAASIVMFVSPVVAETFFDRTGTEWSVKGIKARSDHNPVCVTFQGEMGSKRIEIYKDFADGELYAIIMNPDWDINDTPGAIRSVRVDLKGRTGSKSLEYYIMVLSNNIIAVRAMTPEFIEPFVKMNHMIFTLPDHGNQSVRFSLKGSEKALETMIECIKEGFSIDLYSNIQKPKPPEIAI